MDPCLAPVRFTCIQREGERFLGKKKSFFSSMYAPIPHGPRAWLSIWHMNFKMQYRCSHTKYAFGGTETYLPNYTMHVFNMLGPSRLPMSKDKLAYQRFLWSKR
jgi:hypothetical protein